MNENIRLNSYIGKKGYTIPKKLLSSQQLENIKNELFMKPFVAIKTVNDDSNPFPAYRENENKIYVPRFYGIKKYGLPDNTEISPGTDISVPFVKELRDYQKDIINTYIKYVNSNVAAKSNIKGNGAILEVFTGRGKTVMALDIISKISKKTLIIVHKEFLMNQWIERINEFLPSAKIGKIQASVCDTDDKDIVIGMLQTLHSKSFEQSLFSQFGMTIIDEVHRIGSEQFSRALFKCITPYMLGISATVERKDKLTNILYMFIGDRIYRDNNRETDKVTVRSINYNSNDTEFNTVEYDFRGNPKYSTMISKLCNFGRRSCFIIQIIKDLLNEKHDKQIMLLAHNRNLLTYIHDSLKDIITIGYYVGGMKEKDLKETETKSVVLATYAMAAEALDIKTLSTLIMATPKTDITQSIGRILRVKGNNPIVVDIIDSHELFQKQWLQRKRYYKKNDYFIYNTDIDNYINMTDTKWNISYDPANKTEKKTKPKCLIQL